MAIIDILKVPDSECPTITVDNTQDYIDATYPGAANGDCNVPYSIGVFHQGDNFTILSFGIILPLGFELWHTQQDDFAPSVEIGVRKVDTFYVPLFPPELYIIFSNYEMALGRFYDVSGVDQDFKLNLTTNNLRVSMSGVPDSLNGQVIPISSFAKVEHTQELI